jgi:hypothetical protein
VDESAGVALEHLGASLDAVPFGIALFDRELR